MYGAWLAGMVLGSVGMAVHHNISHVLGGSFGLRHADVHTVILPYAAAFNRDAAPEAMRIVADALGVKDAAQGLRDLEVRLQAPTSLKQIGMPEDQLDRAAQIVVEHAYYNPRPVEFEESGSCSKTPTSVSSGKSSTSGIGSIREVSPRLRRKKLSLSSWRTNLGNK